MDKRSKSKKTPMWKPGSPRIKRTCIKEATELLESIIIREPDADACRGLVDHKAAYVSMGEKINHNHPLHHIRSVVILNDEATIPKRDTANNSEKRALLKVDALSVKYQNDSEIDSYGLKLRTKKELD
jgi:hypothetical protein